MLRCGCEEGGVKLDEVFEVYNLQVNNKSVWKELGQSCHKAGGWSTKHVIYDIFLYLFPLGLLIHHGHLSKLKLGEVCLH
jgi:hypothetical protein